jgi:hypothetical protein
VIDTTILRKFKLRDKRYTGPRIKNDGRKRGRITVYSNCPIAKRFLDLAKKELC